MLLSFQDTFDGFRTLPVNGNRECRPRCRGHAPENEQDLSTENRIAQHAKYFPQEINSSLSYITKL